MSTLTPSQRNHERLIQRVEQAETENDALHKANSANRDDLRAAERLLDQVLSMDISPQAYETLSQVAESLMAVRKRLSSNGGRV